MQYRIIVALAAVSVALSGCASPDNSVGRYKVGKPYSIRGTTYYPEENYTQVQTGVASWYGPGFHGKKTANGERFDQNALTAAHPTLQMPSLVRVTNLENGMSTVLRVNDRGPFHGNRIIDVSKAGAEALGFRNMGTARVRVQVMGPESMALANAARKGVDTRGAEIAMNANGMLDERFAGFYPNLVTAPEPQIVVASENFQPGVAPGQTLDAAPLAVPLPPVRPVLETAQETISMTDVIAANVEPAPAPKKQPVFQMSPIADANAGEMPPIPVTSLQQGDIVPLPPHQPNRLPETPAFRGVRAHPILE